MQRNNDGSSQADDAIRFTTHFHSLLYNHPDPSDLPEDPDGQVLSILVEDEPGVSWVKRRKTMHLVVSWIHNPLELTRHGYDSVLVSHPVCTRCISMEVDATIARVFFLTRSDDHVVRTVDTHVVTLTRSFAGVVSNFISVVITRAQH